MVGVVVERDVRAVLGGLDLFRQLEPAVLERLAGRVVHRRYEAGEALVEQGRPGGSVVVVLSGAATVYRGTGGTRVALDHLRPPAVVGEETLLDAAPRTATVEAVEPTEAIELARDDLLHVLQTQPAFLDGLLQALGAQVRRLSDQAADKVVLDLSGRVAKTLVDLAGSDQAPVVRLSQSRLAELAGGSRQSLNAVLGTFAARGFVRVEGRSIVIADIGGLRRRAGLRSPAAATARVR